MNQGGSPLPVHRITKKSFLLGGDDRTEMDSLTAQILEVIDRSVQSPANPNRSTWTWAARFRLADEIAVFVHRRDAERTRRTVLQRMN